LEILSQNILMNKFSPVQPIFISNMQTDSTSENTWEHFLHIILWDQPGNFHKNALFKNFSTVQPIFTISLPWLVRGAMQPHKVYRGVPDKRRLASATLLYPPMPTTKGSPVDQTRELNKFELLTHTGKPVPQFMRLWDQ
jgi:hypothetical protein